MMELMLRCLCLALTLAACRHVSEPGGNAITILVTASQSADEVEAQTAKIERVVARIPGYARTRSISEWGRAAVTVYLDEDHPVTAAIQSLEAELRHAELDRATSTRILLPASSRRVRYALRSDRLSAMALRTLQDTVIRERLERVSDVSRIETCGGSVEQWQIHADPRKLAAFGLTLRALERAGFETALANQPAGVGAPPTVRTARLARFEDLVQLAVTSQRGEPVRITDVAMVQVGSAPVTCEAIDRRGNFVEGIVVVRQGGAAAKVRTSILAAFAELTTALPPGATITPIASVAEASVGLPPDLFDVQAQTMRRMSDALARIPDLGYALELGEPGDDRFSVPSMGPGNVHVMTDRAVDLVPVFAAISGIGGVETDGDELVRVRGPQLDQLARLAEEARAAAAEIPGVQVLRVLGIEQVPELSVEIDRAMALRLKLDLDDVAAAVRAAQGTVVGVGGPVGHAVTIVLDVGGDKTRLGTPPEGLSVGDVPLAQVVKLTRLARPRAILHDNGRRWAGLRLHVASADARRALADRLARLAIPPGYDWALSD